MRRTVTQLAWVFVLNSLVFLSLSASFLSFLNVTSVMAQDNYKLEQVQISESSSSAEYKASSSVEVYPLSFSNDQKLIKQARGVSVTPSIVNLDLSLAEPSAELFYTNNTNSTIEVSFSAVDFSDMQDGWKVRFLDEKESKNYKYSLSSWIDFEKASITLGPSEMTSVKVFFQKDRLTQGGHYASIQAEILPKSDTEKGKVSIKSILSTLVFVRGGSAGTLESGEISSFTAKSAGEFLFPSAYSLRFKNTGNVHLVPYGVVEVKDVFGEVVAKGILNEGSLVVLPETIRGFDIPVVVLRAFVNPGFYIADFKLKYGVKGDKTITYQTKFFSLGSSTPLQLVLSVFALIGILVLLFSLVKKRFFGV